MLNMPWDWLMEDSLNTPKTPLLWTLVLLTPVWVACGDDPQMQTPPDMGVSTNWRRMNSALIF